MNLNGEIDTETELIIDNLIDYYTNIRKQSLVRASACASVSAFGANDLASNDVFEIAMEVSCALSADERIKLLRLVKEPR